MSRRHRDRDDHRERDDHRDRRRDYYLNGPPPGNPYYQRPPPWGGQPPFGPAHPQRHGRRPRAQANPPPAAASVPAAEPSEPAPHRFDTVRDGITFHASTPNTTLTVEQHSASDPSSTSGHGGDDDENDCLACTRIARRRARLACGHTWCRRCLRRHIRGALRQGDAAWPPRCCGTGDEGVIGEGVVEWLGDDVLMALYRRTALEIQVPVRERVYCHVLTCASFIPPAHHHVDRRRGPGSRTAECQVPTCRAARTCVECGTQAHNGRECPEDPDLAAVMQTIEAHGYQFCSWCNAVVERIDGCNHIRCRCGHNFCYLCGAFWSDCSCPQYGGQRPPRRAEHLPRLEGAVRERLAGPGRVEPSIQPQQNRNQPPPPPPPEEDPRWGHMPPDAAQRRQLEQEDAEARRAAAENEARMQQWAQEEAEARRLAAENEGQMQQWAQEEAEARRQAAENETRMQQWQQEEAMAARRLEEENETRMQQWAREDEEARRQAGIITQDEAQLEQWAREDADARRQAEVLTQNDADLEQWVREDAEARWATNRSPPPPVAPVAPAAPRAPARPPPAAARPPLAAPAPAPAPRAPVPAAVHPPPAARPSPAAAQPLPPRAPPARAPDPAPGAPGAPDHGPAPIPAARQPARDPPYVLLDGLRLDRERLRARGIDPERVEAEGAFPDELPPGRGSARPLPRGQGFVGQGGRRQPGGLVDVEYLDDDEINSLTSGVRGLGARGERDTYRPELYGQPVRRVPPPMGMRPLPPPAYGAGYEMPRAPAPMGMGGMPVVMGYPAAIDLRRQMYAQVMHGSLGPGHVRYEWHM